MKKTILLLLVLYGLLYNPIEAQDIHFSQFYASPLTLNPAMCGKIANKYRFAGNYRNQWGSVSVPFVTFSASYDMPFATKAMKNNFFGGGLIVYSDKSGSGNLSNQSVYLSLAYHQKIARSRIRHPKHYISMGLQAGYVQKQVKIANLVFPAMWDANTKTFINASNENFKTSGTLSYADFTAGVMETSFINDMFSVYGGVTMHHLTTPKETFLVPSTVAIKENKLNNRLTFHAGGKISINENMFLNPSVLVLSQTRSSEVVIGSSLAFIMADMNYRKGTEPSAPTFFVGTWYRVGDALITLVGFEVHDTRVGISYDINLSSLRKASLNKGGYELTLVHEGNPKSAPRKVIYCPRF